MNLTMDEELRLKKIIRSDEKEILLVELSREIEEKEKAMVGNISRDYLSIINKCTDLERIKQMLPKVLEMNDRLGAVIRDGIMQRINVMNEIEENDRIKVRLDAVIAELRGLLGFMEKASRCEDVVEDARDSPLYYYDLTRNVLKMKEGVCTFQKYVFFTSLSQIYTRIKRNLTRLMIKDVDLWVKQTCNDVRGVGMEICKASMDLKKTYVFDVLGSLRRKIITKKFLAVLYGARKIGIDSVILEKVNSRRREFVEEMLKGSDPSVVSTVTGFVLWSHYLLQLDTGFKTHNKVIFDLLARNEQLLGVSDTKRLRDMLIPLRMLVVHLNMDFEDLDRIVGSVAINYFESHGPRDEDLGTHDMESVRASMFTFIDECNGFVSNVFQFSNELDELLAKKIDSYLCSLLEKNCNDVNVFIETQNATRSILNYAIAKNDFYSNVDFRCLIESERINEKFVKDTIDDNKLRIDKLFEEAAEDDFGVNLLQLFSKVRDTGFAEESDTEIKKELVCCVRDRFLGMLEGKKEMPESDRRILIGHACSFYGYLRKNEGSICAMFDPVIELSKKDYDNRRA